MIQRYCFNTHHYEWYYTSISYCTGCHLYHS